MNTKHTPGPWKADDRIYELKRLDKIFVSGENGFLISSVHAYNKDVVEAEANASLIIAAPELLEALEAVMAWAKPDDEECTSIPCFKKARAAIAKATGAQS